MKEEMKLGPCRSGGFAIPQFNVPREEIQPGVYFLLRQKEVVYIGSSIRNAISRSCQHIGGKEFDEVVVLWTPTEWRDDFVRRAELALMRWCRPILNRKEPACRGTLAEAHDIDRYWLMPSDAEVIDWARVQLGDHVIPAQQAPISKIVPPAPIPPFVPSTKTAVIEFPLWDAYDQPSFVALYDMRKLPAIGILQIDENFPRPFRLADNGLRTYVLVSDLVAWVEARR